MKKLIHSVFFLFMVTSGLFSQKQGFPQLTGPYLGQKLPGTTPEIFAPEIISTENAWEAAISFSPDGKEIFFTPIIILGGGVGGILTANANSSLFI